MQPKLELIQPLQPEKSVKCFEVELARKPLYWHFHDEIEMTYILEGKGLRFVGNHIGMFNPGEILITGANLPHDFNMQSVDKSSRILVIQFRQEILKPFPELHEITKMLNNAQKGLLFESPDNSIGQKWCEIENQSAPNKLISLLEILNLLCSQQSLGLLENPFVLSQNSTSMASRLQKVLNFIHQNFTQPITLESMAETNSLTPQSFSRWFKQNIGVSLITYINKLRIESACRELCQTDKQISVIALNSGFESLSSFNRQFLKLKGRSPREYRKAE